MPNPLIELVGEDYTLIEAVRCSACTADARAGDKAAEGLLRPQLHGGKLVNLTNGTAFISSTNTVQALGGNNISIGAPSLHVPGSCACVLALRLC